VTEYGVIIDFGYSSTGHATSGLSIHEIGIDDVLQCGDEYRIVQRLVYMDATTKIGRSRYRYVHTSGTMRSIAAQRPWYRISISSEIRAALIDLPIERLRDVTVESVYKTGRRMNSDVNTYLNVDRAEFYNAVINTNNPEDTLVVGDYIRVGTYVLFPCIARYNPELVLVLAVIFSFISLTLPPFIHP
jgi:hypothetical protein